MLAWVRDTVLSFCQEGAAQGTVEKATEVLCRWQLWARSPSKREVEALLKQSVGGAPYTESLAQVLTSGQPCKDLVSWGLLSSTLSVLSFSSDICLAGRFMGTAYSWDSTRHIWVEVPAPEGGSGNG